MSRRILCFLFIVSTVHARTLSEIICSRNDKICSSNGVAVKSSPKETPRHKTRDLTSPSFNELYRWENYETMEQGTGLQPDQQAMGPNGVPYGPGLGDVEIRSGLGIGYGIGNLGIRRDFGLFMGGSGRSGGQAFGWGNGYQRLNGAAPWFNP